MLETIKKSRELQWILTATYRELQCWCEQDETPEQMFNVFCQNLIELDRLTSQEEIVDKLQEEITNLKQTICLQ